MSTAAEIVNADFPVGVTLKSKRWVITECIAGEAARGLFRVTGEQGTGLLTTAPQQKLPLEELYKRFTSIAANVAELLYIGPLETSYARYDGLIEAEPAGTPLAGKRLELAAAQRVIVDLCEIVARAHVTGFVLRGIRPELIYVDERLRVTGLAPRCEPFLMSARSPCSGVVHCFDTLYGAPEALMTATPAADVFSLAAVAAELLTEDHPFVGENAHAQLHSIAGNQRRPWRGPAALAAAIDRGLARDPADRPSPRELSVLLTSA